MPENIKQTESLIAACRLICVTLLMFGCTPSDGSPTNYLNLCAIPPKFLAVQFSETSLHPDHQNADPATLSPAHKRELNLFAKMQGHAFFRAAYNPTNTGTNAQMISDKTFGQYKGRMWSKRSDGTLLWTEPAKLQPGSKKRPTGIQISRSIAQRILTLGVLNIRGIQYSNDYRNVTCATLTGRILDGTVSFESPSNLLVRIHLSKRSKTEAISKITFDSSQSSFPSLIDTYISKAGAISTRQLMRIHDHQIDEVRHPESEFHPDAALSPVGPTMVKSNGTYYYLSGTNLIPYGVSAKVKTSPQGFPFFLVIFVLVSGIGFFLVVRHCARFNALNEEG